MPYISINTSAALSDANKATLVSELGRLITIIPGKTEADLIVDLSTSRAMFMGGKKTPSAYIDLRVYTKTTDEAKKLFTREVFTLLNHELGIKTEHLYMTIAEFDNWGYDGEFH
ncbi:MAG: hypothetical protein LBD22_05695 [Spirochaetaceae bacterium]|jgi:phenylpyruvate tautomerase PptA (4-oxalocrotonate tautomerase family)|nr:hypothetical protein [Spirochaetaceae bacterium]